MRCLILILLLAAAAAPEEVLLLEKRAWKGTVEVTSVSSEPQGGRGHERQRERLEFVLLTAPPKKSVAWPRVPLRMRDGRGEFDLTIDMREGEGERVVIRKGRGAGLLHPHILGFVEPSRRRYGLKIRAAPNDLVAKTTLSGMGKDGFATWRSITARRSFLANLQVTGEVTADGRMLSGKRAFVDNRAPLARTVEITWRIERVDPVVRGRVTDHRGRPVAGVAVLARTTNPVRIRGRLPPFLREGRTDADGRFSIPVFWAHWGVEVVGQLQAGTVFQGHKTDAAVRFDGVPHLDVSVAAYDLRAMPYARLLKRHFQGDVGRYL
ncbi:MAG: carboxypeptidase-like regulatory domain-containing protein, partial [Planctomycetota bacterium]